MKGGLWEEIPIPRGHHHSQKPCKSQLDIGGSVGSKSAGGHTRASRPRDYRALRPRCFQDSERLHVCGGSWSTQGPGNGATEMGSAKILKGSLLCPAKQVFFLLKVTRDRPGKGFDQRNDTGLSESLTKHVHRRSTTSKLPAVSPTPAHPPCPFGHLFIFISGVSSQRQEPDVYLSSQRSWPYGHAPLVLSSISLPTWPWITLQPRSRIGVVYSLLWLH